MLSKYDNFIQPGSLLITLLVLSEMIHGSNIKSTDSGFYFFTVLKLSSKQNHIVPGDFRFSKSKSLFSWAGVK